MKKQISKNNVGFTLAEVLITLGVIGIVAAMTLPTLVNNYKEKETINKLKKMNSVLSQAFLSVTYEYGMPDTWETTETQKQASTNLFLKFKSYLKIVQDCGYEKGCFADVDYKQFDGNLSINFITNYNYRYMITLADGSAIAFLSGANSFGGCVYYDTNGHKGPNQFGKDLFQWDILKNRIAPSGIDNKNIILPNCTTTGYCCSAWVLTNENMDYLHCPDKLNWDTKTSCK